MLAYAKHFDRINLLHCAKGRGVSNIQIQYTMLVVSQVKR